MDYIYIETKPGKFEEFIKLLDDKGIAFAAIGYNSVMIHRHHFILVGRILDNEMINSFASKIEGL